MGAQRSGVRGGGSNTFTLKTVIFILFFKSRIFAPKILDGKAGLVVLPLLVEA